MRQLTCDPETEVIGQAMLSLIDNLRSESISPLLEKHDLLNIDPKMWYPASRWIDFMNELGAAGGGLADFVAIGMAIAEKVQLPPEAENATLEDILNMMEHSYHMQHRKGDIGNVVTEKIDEGHFKLTDTGIYPDNLQYGVCYGFVRRFRPPGQSFTVKFDEDIPRRDEGGEVTIIHVVLE